MLTYTDAVAVLTINTMVSTCLVELMEVLTEEAFQILRGSAFRCIASAVLSIFDMEDFQKIHDFQRFLDEYNTFSSGLDPNKRFAEQKVDLEMNSILREHDIFYALKSFQDVGGKDRTEEGIWNYGARFLISDSSDYDFKMAEMVIKNSALLKRDDRMQLILELMFKKQYLVSDALVLRVLRGIVIDKACNENLVIPAAKENKKFALEAAGTLSQFVHGVTRGLFWLMDIKSSALHNFQEALIFPLRDHGCFGPCKDEVIEIIKFADFERRMKNERFITRNDFLFCLSLSRVGSSVKKLLDEQLSPFPEFSIFMMCKLARDIAGSGECMTLDHLVMAFFPGKHAVKDNTSMTDGKILDDSAWDAKLRKRLDVRGYEQGDVRMWNSFSKSLEDSAYKTVFEFTSARLVSKQLRRRKYQPREELSGLA